MPWFYYMLKIFFLNLKGLSDAGVASLTKKDYGLVLISDESFSAISWSSLLFWIFTMKKSVEFSLTSFGNLKYDCE